MQGISFGNLTIGKLAVLITMADENKKHLLIEEGEKKNFKICSGKVGTMKAEKIVSAIFTAAKREGLWNNSFSEEHALYDATIEAINGVCRGQPVLEDVMRTVGLNFCVVRGKLVSENKEWFAVALYGTIGAPIKGFEHEAIGLGINHI